MKRIPDRLKSGQYATDYFALKVVLQVLLRTESTPAGCLVFTGAKTRLGYGEVNLLGKPWQAHRAVWVAAHGLEPTRARAARGRNPHDYFEVCHHCDNPPCVRLSHLFPGTHQANAVDMVMKGRKRGGWAVRRG